jgi:hypothetical protein
MTNKLAIGGILLFGWMSWSYAQMSAINGQIPEFIDLYLHDAVSYSNKRESDSPRARTVIYLTPHAALEGPGERTAKHVAATRTLGAAAVADFNVLLAPVNEVCLAAKKADPLWPLRFPARGKGNVHQRPVRSLLAALTIFSVITGPSPVGIPVEQVKPDKFTPVETDLGPAQTRWLQALVLRTLRDHPGILLNIIETSPGTPDGAKAKQLIEDRTKKREKS